MGRLNRVKKGLMRQIMCRFPFKHLSWVTAHFNIYCSWLLLAYREVFLIKVSQWDLPPSNRVFGSTKLSWMEKGLLIIASLEVMDGMYLSTCSIYSFRCADAEAEKIRVSW